MSLHDPEDWAYLSEGNAHALFSFIGASPTLAGHVLRIAKERVHRPDAAPSPADLRLHRLMVPAAARGVAGPEGNPLEALVEWMAEEFREFLGERHLPRPYPYDTPAAFLGSLAALASGCTRRGRWAGLPLRLLPGSASLLPDYTSVVGPLPAGYSARGASICVEIKPKCGFLPTCPTIAAANACKRATSRYQLHQRLKAQEGKTSHVSSYDPVAFFSGDRAAIRRELEHLAACPQNNFAVFIDSRPVYGAQAPKQTDPAPNTLINASPLSLLDAALASEGAGLRAAALLDLVSDSFSSPPHSQLLPGLLALQRLDILDIEGAHRIWTRLHQLEASFPPKPTLKTDRGPPPPVGLDRLLSEAARISALFPSHLSHEEAVARLDLLPLEDCLWVLRGFVAAQAAKDCSLMVALRRAEPGPIEGGCSGDHRSRHDQAVYGSGPSAPEPLGLVQGPPPPAARAAGGPAAESGAWAVSVRVADLEAKNVARMHVWFALDRSIVAAAGVAAGPEKA